jgi:hypothetical protein
VQKKSLRMEKLHEKRSVLPANRQSVCCFPNIKAAVQSSAQHSAVRILLGWQDARSSVLKYPFWSVPSFNAACGVHCCIMIIQLLHHE